MKTALVTGAHGFVGNYLVETLVKHDYKVWSGSRGAASADNSNSQNIQIDLSNKNEVMNILNTIKPDVIFHLSGQSSVKKSWNEISETFDSNIMNTINLLESIKDSEICKKVTLVSIGSSEEYGLVHEYPILEQSQTNPLNPYGITKLTISKLGHIYGKAYGMKVIHTRPFNHIGPGQRLGFVTSDFAKQVVEIERGIVEPKIYVGDLSAKRDFTDVRDIVDAYRLVYEKGMPGEVYNICSGKPVSIEKILRTLLSFSSKPVQVIIDEKKLRPNDIPEYYGSYDKLYRATGWKPSTDLSTSLRDIYMYWKGDALNE